MATIQKIYELACLTPSSFNLQPWRVILVSSPEKKQTLRDCAFGQPKVTEASQVAIVLGDREAFEKDNMDPILDDFIDKGFYPPENRDMLLGMAKGLYGGRESQFASRNAGLFAMSFMYAAKSLGVDTHPMDGFDAAAIVDRFGIPPRYEVVMLIAIGKFDSTKTLLERGARKPFDKVITVDTL